MAHAHDVAFAVRRASAPGHGASVRAPDAIGHPPELGMESGTDLFDAAGHDQ